MNLDTRLAAAGKSVTASFRPFPYKDPPALYATYQRATGRRHSTLNSGAGAERATFQIDVWGKAKGPVRELADQLKDAFPGLLKVGEITDNPDDYENDIELHRASFDVTVWA
ncbi:conserved hypothetical protein [Stenotrophomonas sp. SKA14]|uniref:tail completion protein gp17 n=1 Tax=Stenotrophomonas TaxID=40323 RepID=UPI00018FF2B7|nr:DUF3168 domain-containing protein [Stenotrophomonas sp. SKA14]EED37645.1 conserved hypothetical protein [Stenotrophomonas sp. SKA14]